MKDRRMGVAILHDSKKGYSTIRQKLADGEMSLATGYHTGVRLSWLNVKNCSLAHFLNRN